MSIQKFENGSILITGNDLAKFLLGNPSIAPACDICVNVDNDDICGGCSFGKDGSCSCHINPPCSYCFNNAYERAPLVIGYYYYSNGYKQFKGFKTTKEIFDKYEMLKKKGYDVNLERLCTKEYSFCLTKNDETDEIIEILPDFTNIRKTFEKIISGANQ